MIMISTLRVGDIRLRRMISILTEWVMYFPAENVKEDAEASCSAYALLKMPTAGPDIFANGKYIIYHIAKQYIIRQRRISLIIIQQCSLKEALTPVGDGDSTSREKVTNLIKIRSNE